MNPKYVIKRIGQILHNVFKNISFLSNRTKLKANQVLYWEYIDNWGLIWMVLGN